MPLLPDFVKQFLAHSTQNPGAMMETLQWLGQGAREEDVWAVEAPPEHLFWEMVAYALPESELSLPLVRRLLEQGQGVRLQNRGIPLPEQLPTLLEQLPEKARQICEAGDLGRAWLLRRTLREAAEAPSLAEEVRAAAEGVRALEGPRSHQEYDRVMFRSARAVVLASLAARPECPREMAERVVQSLALRSSLAWGESLKAGEHEELLRGILAREDFEPRTALRLAKRRDVSPATVRALSQVPGLRQHPQIRAEIRKLPELEVWVALALEAEGAEFQQLWQRILSRSAGAAARVLTEREGPIPLPNEALRPLLASPVQQVRTAAIQALGRLMGEESGREGPSRRSVR